MATQSRQLISQSRPHEPLRVLLDARKLGHGGIGAYLESLILGLLSVNRLAEASAEELRLVAGGGSRSPSGQSNKYQQEPVTLSILCAPGAADAYAWRKHVRVIEDRAIPYSIDEMFFLPRRIDWSQFNLFHTPHFMLPFGIPVARVVTVHDLIHLQAPESWYYPPIASRLIRSALARATRVVTVSEATHTELRRFVSGSERFERRLRVIPNAVHPTFVSSPPGDLAPNSPHTRSPYALALLSNNKPHKGARDLLRAWQIGLRAAAGSGQGARLLIAGEGSLSLCEDAEFLHDFEDGERISLLGPLPPHELVRYFKAAKLLIAPSRLEGFGLPVLEAHALGVPSVMRPVPALLELATAEDFVAEDMSIDAFGKAIARGLRSAGPTDARALSEATQRRYAANDVARATANVYREAVTEFFR